MRATGLLLAVFLAGLSMCLGFVVPSAPLRSSSFAPRQAAVAAMPEGRASRGARGMTMMGGKVRESRPRCCIHTPYGLSDARRVEQARWSSGHAS